MENRILKRADAGFTLIEAMLAMVILGIVLVSFSATVTQRLTGNLRQQDLKAAAVQLATDRLRTIQLDPVYDKLVTRYVATETGITGYPGYTRQTVMSRVVASSNDYTLVTVKVTRSAGLTTPIYRSVAIAAP
jgi:prepilin-type N-terminal cleavage/methylation domain-containing protein